MEVLREEGTGYHCLARSGGRAWARRQSEDEAGAKAQEVLVTLGF